MTRVFVHIDALRLAGFPAEARLAIADGIRGELACVLSEPGAAAGLIRADAPVLRASVAQYVDPGDSAGSLGRAVARNIGRSIAS